MNDYYWVARFTIDPQYTNFIVRRLEHKFLNNLLESVAQKYPTLRTTLMNDIAIYTGRDAVVFIPEHKTSEENIGTKMAKVFRDELVDLKIKIKTPFTYKDKYRQVFLLNGGANNT